MGTTMMVIKTGIVCAIISFCMGCAVQKTDNTAGIEADQYAVETARLEAMIREDPGSSRSWQAHYKLSKIYTSYNNPSRNYEKSLEHLEIYLPHHPASADDHDIQNWLSVLYEVQERSPEIVSQQKKIRQLTEKLKESRQEVAALKEENGNIEKHNVELAMTIDVLKTLDQGVEEKRRNYSFE